MKALGSNGSEHLKDLLDKAYKAFSNKDFISNDPICIPHGFSKKEDIEIAGFLTATIAWGQRTTIINNATKLMGLMDNAPFDFIMNHLDEDLLRMQGFVHRTFNDTDLLYFIASLKHIYTFKGGLERVFSESVEKKVFDRIAHFQDVFFELDHPKRTKKHISDPRKGSSAKRLNMYLRWMVRSDKEGIDFGIWKNIPMSSLMMPLDVHTSTQARRLGLLLRKQDDWRAVEELTGNLAQYDATDPVKYDFALFGMGVNQKLQF